MSYPGQVLVFSGVRGDTRRYRSLHLYEQLRLAGVDCAFSHLTDPRLLALVKKASVVILHRVAYDRYVEKLFETFRQNNILTILDSDDYLYDPAAMQWINSPDFADPVRASLYRSSLLRHRRTLELCHAVTASTNYLAGLLEPFGKPAWVHRNAFSLEMLHISEEARAARPAARESSPVVIGYASGTPTHNRDFEIIRPALMKVMARFPQVELQLLGPLDPGEAWGDLRQRIRRINLVPWRQLPWLLANFDINLAPLVIDNPFSQSKSEIKYMEAAMLAVPTVASPTDAFSHAIRQGENGFLASSEQEWVAHLSTLVEDAARRSVVGSAAYGEVMAAYHPETRARDLAILLDEVALRINGKRFWNGGLPSPEGVRARSSQLPRAGACPPEMEKGPTYLQMGLYTLRSRGLWATIKYAWIFLRRLLSPLIPFQSKPKKI